MPCESPNVARKYYAPQSLTFRISELQGLNFLDTIWFIRLAISSVLKLAQPQGGI